MTTDVPPRRSILSAAGRRNRSPAALVVLRKADFARRLCNAVAACRLVEVRLSDNVSSELFAPHAMIRGARGMVHVCGLFLSDPAAPMPDGPTVILDIGQIVGLSVTDLPFEPGVGFERNDKRYGGAIICSV